MPTRLVNSMLIIAAVAAALAMLEVGVRGRAGLVNRGVLSPDFTPLTLPAAEVPVSLAHLLRLSRNPRRIYELRPRLSVLYQGGRVSTNERGLRRPSPSHPDVDARRVVGIGDSVMFGQGVDDDETYLAVLSRRLAEHAGPGGLQVVNTAVPGYNTVMEVETLRDVGLAFDPDVVIIEMVGNDLGLPNFIREPEAVWALDRSFLADFVRARIGAGAAERRDLPPDQALNQLGVVRAPLAADRAGEFVSTPERAPPAYRDMVGWDAFAGAMRELARLGEQRDFRIVWMVLVPGRRPLRDRATALATALGFVVVDAEREMRRFLSERGMADYFDSPLARAPDDGHPTALGHQIAARALERAFLEHRLLAGDPAPGSAIADRARAPDLPQRKTARGS